MKLRYSSLFIDEADMSGIKPLIQKSHKLIEDKTGQGNEFLGWADLPSSYDKNEFERIKEAANRIESNSEVLIVIGVGGSYLGARACIEALNHSFYNILPKEKRKFPELYFVGNNLSSKYLLDLIENIQDKDISVNVISKSGTTMEPSIAFRIFRDIIEKKYGKKGAKDRIFVTTDKSKGALKELANVEGYESFVIPSDICGRYSIFTAVGLLPMAVAGIDIDKILDGAYSGMVEYGELDLDNNICYQYAAIRNILYGKGKEIEILASYEPSLFYLSEWWKQLFGESEGKNGKGLYPASANYTTDLHSFGQLVQDGKRNIFQTILIIDKPDVDISINYSEEDCGELNYLEGRTLDYINKMAFEGALVAHEIGGVPNIVITLPELNEFYFGKLIYFFLKACAISAYTMGVNPFDQPAVEQYKSNMYRLLGR